MICRSPLLRREAVITRRLLARCTSLAWTTLTCTTTATIDVDSIDDDDLCSSCSDSCEKEHRIFRLSQDCTAICSTRCVLIRSEQPKKLTVILSSAVYSLISVRTAHSDTAYVPGGRACSFFLRQSRSLTPPSQLSAAWIFDDCLCTLLIRSNLQGHRERPNHLPRP